MIRENGEEPTIRVADEGEYADRLVNKLEEEVKEYRESHNPDELADIFEVVHAIRMERGLIIKELQEIRTRKAEQRGRFDDRIVLERIEK